MIGNENKPFRQKSRGNAHRRQHPHDANGYEGSDSDASGGGGHHQQQHQHMSFIPPAPSPRFIGGSGQPPMISFSRQRAAVHRTTTTAATFNLPSQSTSMNAFRGRTAALQLQRNNTNGSDHEVQNGGQLRRTSSTPSFVSR